MSRKRRIYFLLPYYPNWIDGGLKYQTKVYEYIRNKYDEVYHYGKSVDIKHSDKFIIRYLSKFKHIIRITISLFHVIKIPKGSVLVLNNAFFLDYLVPIFLNRFWKKHIYLVIVHHLIQKDRPTYLRIKLETYFIRKADKIITVSNISHSEIMKILKAAEVPIINPGLEINLKNEPIKIDFSSKQRILFVGGIEERKGIIYLIEALSTLKYINFELNIVGRTIFNDYFKFLKNKVDEYGLGNMVFFRGRISDKELSDLYSNSTIFVFPSIWEGYGMVVSEAMSYGLPVIASKIPAMEELIQDGVNGILFEPKNPDSLRNSLLMLFGNKDLQVRLSRNAFERAGYFVGWEQSSDKIWKIMKDYI